MPYDGGGRRHDKGGDDARTRHLLDIPGIPGDVITMNSRVRLLDLHDGSVLEYTLVYPGDADYAAGKISVVAPIGAAMIGYKVGDEIEWEVPAGRRRFRIEAVLYQPEAAGDHHL